MNSQNYTIAYPEFWRPVKHHGYYGFTPLKRYANIFENLVSIFQYRLNEKQEFKEFVDNQINKANEVHDIISQEILNVNNNLGNVYIHKYESHSNGRTYKNYVMYFEHNGEYYNCNYSSLRHKYHKYYEDAISIFQSIKFK